MPRRSSGSHAHAFRLTRALIALALTITALAFACRATSTPEGEHAPPTRHHANSAPPDHSGAPH